MGILRKLAAWGALAAALGVVLLFAMPSYRQGEASVAGKTAQDFPLEIAGKPGHLTDLKGKVVILNFWATWCPPCVEETPALNRLQKYIESRNGVILGVAADEDPAAYEKFLHEQGVIFQTYRDPSTKDNHSPIAREYGIGGWDVDGEPYTTAPGTTLVSDRPIRSLPGSRRACPRKVSPSGSGGMRYMSPG